jgi:uncharacterized Zn finger protein
MTANNIECPACSSENCFVEIQNEKHYKVAVLLCESCGFSSEERV